MTRKRVQVFLLFGIMLMLIIAFIPMTNIFAATYQDTIDEITNVRKNSVYHIDLNAPFSKDTSGVRETVNPETGALSVSYDLFSLPGRGGVNSANLSLMYYSQTASAKEESAEYSEEIATYVNQNVVKSVQGQALEVFGIGWRLQIPYVEIPDERNKSVVYVHLPDGAVYKQDDSKTGLSDYKLKDLSFETCDETKGGVKCVYRLRYIDGREYYFGENGFLAESSDRFHNVVTYCWTSDAVPVLEKVYDNSGDVVSFTYNNNLVTVQHNERVYKIVREQAEEAYKLCAVTDPTGRTTSFTYTETGFLYNFFGSLEKASNINTYHLLSRIDYCTGAYTAYQYETAKKWLYEENGGDIQYPRISSRYDVIGDEKLSKQTYQYHRSHDGYPTYTSDKLPGNYVYSTEVKDSFGTTEKYIYDKNHNQTGYGKSVNGRAVMEETRQYEKVSRMPELFEEKNFDESGESRSVYTASVYDDRGNLVKTDTYQTPQEKGKNICKYTYSTGKNLCIYESRMKDEDTKIEIFRTLTADGNHFASEKIVENGTEIKKDLFSYDSYGNLTEEKIQTDEVNRIKIRYSYDSTTSHQFPTKTVISGIKNADGENESYTYFSSYDAYGNCVRQENPDGTFVSYTYDKLDRITKEQLEDGLFRETIYDDMNNTITTTDAKGLKLLYSYDKCGKIISVDDVKNKINLLNRTYDAEERLQTETDSLGTKYVYDYDALDRYTSLLVYDASGTLMSEKYLSYDDVAEVSGGKGTKLTLEEGEVVNRRKTVYLFDYLDRLLQTTQISGEETRTVNFEYDLAGNNTVSISPSGAVTKMEYDCFGNAIRTVLPDGTQNTFTYDFLGNITSESNGAGEQTEYVYDGLSRLTRTETEDGERRSIERTYYDFRGNAVKTLDANNNKALYTYNARGFLETVQQFENGASGQEVNYDYDGEGNTSKMSVGGIGEKKRHTYSYALDLYGRVLSETDPLGEKRIYEYDSEGNVTRFRNKNGVVTDYVYDGLGRVLKQTNSKNGALTYAYTEFGELAHISDGTLSAKNRYNAFGELLETKRNASAEQFTYDADGNVLTRTVTDNDMGEVKTAYTYDVLGRPTAISTGAGTEYVTYDNAGRIAKKTIDSQNTEKHYSYYKNGRLKTVLTYRNGELINTENSEYDAFGNKTLEEINGNITRYAYDGLNRLKRVTAQNGDQTEYEFDSFGNISKEYTLTPGDIKTKIYHYDNANRLILMYDDTASAEYTYDAEGNMLTKVSDAGGSVSQSNYVYDGYNRLSEFYSQNTEAQYSYNPEGLRESKTVNGNTTRFLYSDANVIGEFMGDDYYIYHRGTELIGYDSFSGKTANYQQNSHGNVTALLDYDGAELKTYTYNAYGEEQAFIQNPEGDQTILYQWKNETETTHNPFRYCGEYTDEETGLVYLRNRYYDPSIGRFITEDPAKDGENWYVYCGGNPVMFVDPSGLSTAEELHSLVKTHGIYAAKRAFELSNKARDAGEKYASSFRLNKTWDNEADAYRHFYWNVLMTRELGYGAARAAANNHEIYSLKDLGWKYSNGHYKMNQATIMDIWNNETGRNMAINPNYKNEPSASLFYEAKEKGLVILNAEDTYEFLGVTDYIVDTGEWTVYVYWDMDNSTMTFKKEGLPDLEIRIGA